MTTTIYLVRHARTAWNAEGRFRGREDPPLDERGLVEAAEAARVLADAGLRAVHSSPLLRCLQTAEVIARTAGVTVTPEPGLIDADLGRWTGVAPEVAERQDPDAYAVFRRQPRRARAPEGEDLADVEGRVFEVLHRIGRRHEAGALAAVSHEIPIRLVASRLMGIRGPGFWDLELPTASITELRFRDGRLSLASEVTVRAAR